MRTLFLVLALLATSGSWAQNEQLQAGPMVGYSGFREALIWVQTTERAHVKIGYYAKGETERFTPSKTANSVNDYIVKLRPNEVEYGKTYNYRLYINDREVVLKYPLQFQTQPLWQYRAEAPDFSFAIGSCLYINEPKDDRAGKGYGGDYEILERIRAKEPDFMIWMGDNIYLRTPDFLTERGIRYRNKTVRSTPELQPLLGSVHHYATWDDHDYGPNDADRSYVHKQIAEQAFNDYWGNLNTDTSGAGGVTQHFPWNDVEFFMMDDRYHRAPNKSLREDKDYFGETQLDWLIDALTTSQATFKIVVNGGQVISDATVYENYATYPLERQKLLDRLHTEKIEGVLFMSGDRHHTEISKLERPDAYPLIDITCSPLTAGTHTARDEGNSLQVEGMTFYDRNFGIVNISGRRMDRTLLLTIYNAQGIKIWDYTVAAKELRYKD